MSVARGWNLFLIPPVAEDSIMKQSYKTNTVNQSGTAYDGEFEYNHIVIPMGSFNVLFRVHNAEGYYSWNNYYYNRKDHLGNIREVWNATTNATVQRTQYYPSGLPWASNTGDNPGTQPYKYNGKEFVEMHGYNGLDYGARTFFPDRGNGSMSVDPLCEKYYSISPYAYCLGNPVKYIDPDGRAPGDFFKTKNGAAKDWGKFYNGKSIAEGKEYASTIYSFTKAGKSGYTYTNAASGTNAGANESLPPNGEQPKAIIHSHGKYENEFGEGNDLFSTKDLNHSDDKNADGYLASPDGSTM